MGIPCQCIQREPREVKGAFFYQECLYQCDMGVGGGGFFVEVGGVFGGGGIGCVWGGGES